MADADSGIRLGKFLDGFLSRSISTAICNGDLGDALTVLVDLLAKG